MTVSPVVVEVLARCSACNGQGYADGAICAPCRGRGSFDLVECPAHRRKVARDHKTGQLLGCCDGCMADAARALHILNTNTNGRASSVFAESTGAAEEVTL